jgi:alkanesulfonate monooxygenase SsuD/methylene tetrahydromethanopterin reductase-like flavin-dependent oxidoreductase (luciferase family)
VADLATGLFLQGFSVDETATLARQAEMVSFRVVWIAESTFGDAFVPAAAAAVSTTRVRIGTGIVGIFGRPAAVMSLSALSLAQAAHGRAVLGLGVQARPYVEDFHGVPFEHGLDRLREYVSIIRQALRGERVSLQGHAVHIKNFQMLAAAQEVPIYLAAVGPKAIQLAGEIADGVLGAFFSPAYVTETVLPNLELGARRAGRSLPDGFDIATIIPTLISDAADAVEQIKPRVMMSITALRSSPYYRESVAQAGFASAADAIIQAVAGGDIPAALRAIPDRLIEELTVCGGRRELCSTLERFATAGLRTALLQPCVPYVFYPYYEGHFPPSVRYPETDGAQPAEGVLRLIRCVQ